MMTTSKIDIRKFALLLLASTVITSNIKYTKALAAETTSNNTITTTPSTLSQSISSMQEHINITNAGNLNVQSESSLPSPKNMSAKDVDEMRKTIQERMDLNHGENRLSMNRPPSPTVMHDFSPDSLEAKIANATTQFGLKFINSLGDTPENVVISPISLQNLLNMLLLGASDNSNTYKQLVNVLGYDQLAVNSTERTLKPHEGMKSLLRSIELVTHLMPNINEANPTLLNTNPSSIDPSLSDQVKKEADSTKTNLEAHLQTSSQDQSTPLIEQVNFTLANLILSNSDAIDILEDYEKELNSYYNVKFEKFSLEAKNETNELPLYARVNSWVKNMTHQQIDKLANENDLNDKDLVLVLLNAAHFKGRWLHTFNPKATQDGLFNNHGDEKKQSKVSYMRQKALFGFVDLTSSSMQADSYSNVRVQSSEDSDGTITMEDSISQSKDEKSPSPTTQAPSLPSPSIELSKEDSRKLELVSKLNCSVLMLPFSLNDGQELSMIILLPAKLNGVKELRESLTPNLLDEVYKLLVDQQVRVELPKFSFESQVDAKNSLQAIGLNQIFDQLHSDRMFNAKSKLLPKVDKVIHKAKITVDETGAEAAAASMASIVLRNFVRPPTSFVVDRPFLFIIRHNRSNLPLFIGQVNSL